MMPSGVRILPRVSVLSNFTKFFNPISLLWLFLIILVSLVLAALNAHAAGISVDVGLTPAEDRWIVRTQLRYMQRHDDSAVAAHKMDRYILNTVVAYGLRRNLTLMLKQPVVYQKMSMHGSTSKKGTSFADLSLLVKYGIYRRNTQKYTLGFATTLGIELPTGADTLTSDTWDIKPGLYMSWRRGPWASDFNLAYVWNGFADKSSHDINPGNEFILNWALAYQFSLGTKADISLTPVLEASYKNISPDRFKSHNVSNTGEAVVYLSPGIKFTKLSFILELLIQIPAWQQQKGSQLKRGTGVLIGSRFMF